MNIESLKIAWACFLGAVAGAFCALKVSPSHPGFAWVGILAGGFAGYVSYQFREVIKTVCIVWQSMPEWEEIRTKIIQRIKFIWFEGAFPVLLMMCFAFSFAIGMMSILITMAYLVSLFCPGIHDPVNPIPLRGSLLGGTIFMLFTNVLGLRFGRRCIPNDLIPVFKGLPLFTPGFAPVLLVIGIPVAGLWLVKEFGLLFTKATAKLIRNTFLAIHSDIRLLCATDAVLGGLIGYYAGSVLIGGIAGAILGVLNYQIVSIRWLKLAPKAT